MKLLLAFFFTLALAISSGKETTLEEDLADFLALLPLKEIQDILLDHLSQDSELQDVVFYLQSRHWWEFCTSIQRIPEYQKIIEYLGSEGVNIQKIIDLLRPSGIRSTERKTLVELLDEIAAVLPAKEFQKLYTKKIKTSPHFVHFLEYLHGPEIDSSLARWPCTSELSKLPAACPPVTLKTAARVLQCTPSSKDRLAHISIKYCQWSQSTGRKLLQALFYQIQILPGFHDIFVRLSEKGVDLYEVVEYIKWLFTGQSYH